MSVHNSIGMEWRTRPPDRSTERELLALLSTHAEREGEVLARYRQLVERSDNPGVRYLAEQIIADEERHHRLIDDVVNLLETQLDEIERRPRTPWLSATIEPGTDRLLQQLLDFERQDAKDLRRLRRRLRHSPRTSLLPLVASMLTHDTAKHIDVLRYIRANTRPPRHEALGR